MIGNARHAPPDHSGPAAPLPRHDGRWPTLWLLPAAIALTVLLAAGLAPDTLPRLGAVNVSADSPGPALRLRLAGPTRPAPARPETAVPEPSSAEAATPESEPAPAEPMPAEPARPVPETLPDAPAPAQPATSEPTQPTRPAPTPTKESPASSNPTAHPTPAPEPAASSAPNAQSGDRGDATVTLNAGASERADDYLSRLTRHLSRFYEYPRRARRLGQEGTAVVQFTFTRDGTLIDHRLSDSSGHDRLDQAALAMLAEAAPLPPVPDTMAGDRFRFVLPVRFRLR